MVLEDVTELYVLGCLALSAALLSHCLKLMSVYSLAHGLQPMSVLSTFKS